MSRDACALCGHPRREHSLDAEACETCDVVGGACEPDEEEEP